MQILKLEVEGYRSLRKVTWEPGALNIIIGPNGSGKSNMLMLLELLATSAKGRLGKYINDAGGMDPQVWDGRVEEIRIALKTSPVENGRDPDRDSLTYELELKRLGKGSAYRIGRELLANYYDMTTMRRSEPFKYLERQGLHAVIFDENETRYVASEEQMLEEETLLSIASGPFIQNRNIPAYQEKMASWSIYQDVRVDREAPIRQPAVTRHERLVEQDGQNLINILHTLYESNRDFKQNINLAMKAAFGDDFEELVFPPDADQRIQLRLRWKSLKREVSATNISDGTLRFLFLLTVLTNPTMAPLIAIDEPETGLHPSMLPIIAEYASVASSRAQIILTTHSPQLLDAFTESRPRITVSRCECGETKLIQLSDDELDYWLAEYSMGTLYASGQLEDME